MDTDAKGRELTDDEKSALKGRVEAFEQAAGDIERFAKLIAEAHGQQLTTIAFTAVTATLIGLAPPAVQGPLVQTIASHLERIREIRVKIEADLALKAASEATK